MVQPWVHCSRSYIWVPEGRNVIWLTWFFRKGQHQRQLRCLAGRRLVKETREAKWSLPAGWLRGTGCDGAPWSWVSTRPCWRRRCGRWRRSKPWRSPPASPPLSPGCSSRLWMTQKAVRETNVWLILQLEKCFLFLLLVVVVVVLCLTIKRKLVQGLWKLWFRHSAPSGLSVRANHLFPVSLY